ncbi:hypothetical protein PLESTB_000871800 [Pleodorina starrii]|uniref:FAS1 domain-containing protein n=1 Tax=Pleodorina starrii TaxID=330485 RepID=A0A9W6BLV6_9CHLO|nr:hypothetical protein PLESTB_000871800 [Pleodorina starrii]GLC76138.1 hypothetical protein PLESTF_001739000 [Pleodorina starrii]
MKTFSSAAGNSITLNINVFPAPPNQLPGTNKYGADTVIVGFASKSLIMSGYCRVPVGGIVPTSYFYQSFDVLLPVYGSIWQYLTSSQLPSSVSYKNVTGLLTAEGNLIIQLQSPITQATFLAPLDSGVSAFLSAYNLTQALGSSFARSTVARVHLLASAMTKSNFTNNSTLTTSSLLNQQLTCLLNVVSPGSVTFYAGQTNATISSAAVDVSILYGRSYVQAVNYVLVPSGVALPGAAGSALPSLLLLAVATLVGRWMALLLLA